MVSLPTPTRGTLHPENVFACSSSRSGLTAPEIPACRKENPSASRQTPRGTVDRLPSPPKRVPISRSGSLQAAPLGYTGVLEQNLSGGTPVMVAYLSPVERVLRAAGQAPRGTVTPGTWTGPPVPWFACMSIMLARAKHANDSAASDRLRPMRAIVGRSRWIVATACAGLLNTPPVHHALQGRRPDPEYGNTNAPRARTGKADAKIWSTCSLDVMGGPPSTGQLRQPVVPNPATLRHSGCPTTTRSITSVHPFAPLHHVDVRRQAPRSQPSSNRKRGTADMTSVSIIIFAFLLLAPGSLLNGAAAAPRYEVERCEISACSGTPSIHSDIGIHGAVSRSVPPLIAQIGTSRAAAIVWGQTGLPVLYVDRQGNIYYVTVATASGNTTYCVDAYSGAFLDQC